MEERICVFVCGPESSGTRMLTKIFVQLGFYGTAEHYQPLDKVEDWSKITNNKIVLRRSLPHWFAFPDLKELSSKIEKGGYRIVPVLILRDMKCTALSQIKYHKPQNIAEAETSIWEGIRLFIDAFVDKNPFLVLYNVVVENVMCLEPLCVRVGIDKSLLGVVDFGLHNGDKKYYEGSDRNDSSS